jgi:hypothetical protein
VLKSPPEERLEEKYYTIQSERDTSDEKQENPHKLHKI